MRRKNPHESLFLRPVSFVLRKCRNDVISSGVCNKQAYSLMSGASDLWVAPWCLLHTLPFTKIKWSSGDLNIVLGNADIFHCSANSNPAC